MNGRNGVPRETVLEPLDNPRVVDSALEAVRNSILEGRMSPGERLLEARLAQELGISRGPLREALHLLEKDGLIYSIPRRGKYVQPLDLTLVDEVYSLRRVLEAFAVERLIEVQNRRGVERLEGALALMQTAAESGNVRMVAQRDIDFHRALVELADHSLLLRAWTENVAGKMHVLLSITVKTHRPLEDALERHRQIIAGLRDGEPATAIELIQSHVDDAWERARRTLIESGDAL